MCVRYQVKHRRKWELVSFFAELTACQVATRPVLNLLKLSSSPGPHAGGRRARMVGGHPGGHRNTAVGTRTQAKSCWKGLEQLSFWGKLM